MLSYLSLTLTESGSFINPILFPLFLNLHLLSQLGVTRQPLIRLSNLKSSLSTGAAFPWFFPWSATINWYSIPTVVFIVEDSKTKYGE